MKKLICHTSMYQCTRDVLTEGKSYPVVKENEYDFMIVDDEGHDHYFSKKKLDGESYKTWFRLEESK
jgi:hypothetical protein